MLNSLMLNEVSELVSRETSKERSDKAKLDGTHSNNNSKVIPNGPPLVFSETPKKIIKDLPSKKEASNFDALQASLN